MCLMPFSLLACSDLPSDVSYYAVDLYNRNKRSKDVLIGEKSFYSASDTPIPHLIKWQPKMAITHLTKHFCYIVLFWYIVLVFFGLRCDTTITAAPTFPLTGLRLSGSPHRKEIIVIDPPPPLVYLLILF